MAEEINNLGERKFAFREYVVQEGDVMLFRFNV